MKPDIPGSYSSNKPNILLFNDVILVDVERLRECPRVSLYPMPWQGVNSGVSLDYIYSGAKQFTPPLARAWDSARHGCDCRKNCKMFVMLIKKKESIARYI